MKVFAFGFWDRDSRIPTGLKLLLKSKTNWTDELLCIHLPRVRTAVVHHYAWALCVLDKRSTNWTIAPVPSYWFPVYDKSIRIYGPDIIMRSSGPPLSYRATGLQVERASLCLAFFFSLFPFLLWLKAWHYLLWCIIVSNLSNSWWEKSVPGC